MSRYKKIYKFDEHNDALNPNVRKHTLVYKNRKGNIILTLLVAKTEIGYISGYKLDNDTKLTLPPIHSKPCYYYNLAHGCPQRAILAALIQITEFMSLEAYPICMIVQVGNLFVDYCQNELSDGAKVG